MTKGEMERRGGKGEGQRKGRRGVGDEEGEREEQKERWTEENGERWREGRRDTSRQQQDQRHPVHPQYTAEQRRQRERESIWSAHVGCC